MFTCNFCFKTFTCKIKLKRHIYSIHYDAKFNSADSVLDHQAKIMTFNPTMEEFANFGAYINYMEEKGAHKFGIAKVIPPTGWVPRKNDDYTDMMDMQIPAPILQVVSSKQKGVYQQLGTSQKSMTVREYVVMAGKDEYRTPDHKNLDDLEKNYWENIVTQNPPLYGADVSGSLTDEDVEVWNINKLGTILDRVNSEYNMKIEGVNTAYLYFGMWKSTFAWHTEDMDLYSINYIHKGSPKTWYAIPPEHGRSFEKLAAGLFVDAAEVCPAFLRHKIAVISPDFLKKNSIPVNKMIHNEGEIVITFPYGYHSGYNNGFNVAEATNFASTRWVEFGKNALQCICDKNAVSFSMETFINDYEHGKSEDCVPGKHIEDTKNKSTQRATARVPKKRNLLKKKVDSHINIYAKQYTNKRHKM